MSGAVARHHGEQRDRAKTFGLEKGPQQRGEIGARGPQSHQQDRLRAVGEAPLLRKPFKATDLAAAVRSALES